MTIALHPENAVASHAKVDLGADSTAGTRPRGLPSHMPTMIPRSQLYYWMRTWQEGEAAALADLEAGRSRVFTNPRELARYLLRPADDD